MELKDFITRISEATGVSGNEEEVGEIIQEAFRTLADDVYVDKLGNVIARKEGKKKSEAPPLMFAAHMDEIGFLVSKAEDGGFIRFEPLGGIDPRTLPGQEVVIKGREKIRGIIGAKPPHVQDAKEREQAIKMEKLFIDCGRSQEELNEIIQVGDFISFYQELTWLKENICAGKALDDRAGVAALSILLKELGNRSHDFDVIAVATVQEEVGLRGAITGSYHINPAVGIAIDVGFARRKGLEKERTLQSGAGPGISWGPHVHPQIFNKLKEIGERDEIPYQLEPVPFPSGTDTYAIQMSRCGVATGLISIPLAYMHTPVETINIKDIKRTGRLLASFCAEADEKFLEGLPCL